MLKQEFTPEMLVALKANHPGPIYKKTLFGVDYVFTVITTAVQKQILDYADRNKSVTHNQLSEKYIDSALLFPQLDPVTQATLPAGVYPTLAQLIKVKSLLALPETVREVESLYTVEVLVDAPDGKKPDENEVAALKAASQHQLHLVTILGNGFVVRPLLRLEWNNLQAAAEGSVDIDAAIAERCTIWPPKPLNFDGGLAGVPNILSRHILGISGFHDEGTVEEL